MYILTCLRHTRIDLKNLQRLLEGGGVCITVEVFNIFGLNLGNEFKPWSNYMSPDTFFKSFSKMVAAGQTEKERHGVAENSERLLHDNRFRYLHLSSMLAFFVAA